MNPQHSVAFLDHFQDLEDPRVERTKRHLLLDMVFIAVTAMAAGANGFVAIAEFGRSKKAWLSRFLELPNGIPSHDTFGRLFAALDTEEFLSCFVSWVQAFAPKTKGQIVAIDGKAARASLDKAKGKNPLHVVSAWVSQNHLLLGQVSVNEKSNEITAIPKLLEMLELKGAIVTIDAMGCQKAIAATIREKGGDYILAVKGNQEHLEEDIVESFAAWDDGEDLGVASSRFETDDKGHGRLEHRTYEAMAVPKTLRNLTAWKDLRSICRVTRTYREGAAEKSEVRYFISSAAADAKKLSAGIRSHWGVENGLHWVLDMYFSEDRSRIRMGDAGTNMALLRRWVLSMLRQDKSLKGSIEVKRLKAGWDEKALETILGLFSVN